MTPRPDAVTYAELLIDCEEDWTLRAVLVGMLRETGRLSASQDLAAKLSGERSFHGGRADREVLVLNCLPMGSRAIVEADESGRRPSG